MSIYTSTFRLLAALSMLCLCENVFAVTITTDPSTGNFIIEYFSEELGRNVQVVLEPRTKIQPTVISEVTTTTQGFVFSFGIQNGVSAKQEIVALDVPSTSPPITFESPSNWLIQKPTQRNSFVGWTAKESGIAPGSQLSGFRFQNSFLPDIAKIRLQGDGDTISFLDEPPVEVEEAVNRLQIDAHNAHVEVVGIAPGTFTFTDPSSAIDRLISLKHQSASLGWLRGEEFIKQLDKKLDQAKKALAEGKGFKARKKLEQFVKKLEHQRKEQQERQKEASENGKEKREEHAQEDKRFIDDNAFFLLKVNAEFIISKLPEKPKDKEEERETKDESDDHD